MDTLKRAEWPGLGQESDTEDQVDLGLFSYGGPFDLFPGPVLVLGQNAMVLGANAAAQPIADMLRLDRTRALNEALATALSGRVAQINPFLVPAEGSRAESPDDSKGASAYDLLILPWANRLAVLILGRDIAVDRSLRTALVDSRQRFKDLVDISSDLAWETDREGRFTFVTTNETLGYQSEDMIGQAAAGFLIGESEPGINPFSSRQPVGDVQVWFRRVDQGSACLSVTAVPLRDGDGVWSGARGLCRDITAEQARDAELSAARAREQLLAYVLRNVRDETEPGDAIMSVLAILQRGFALDGVVLFQSDDSASFTEIAQRGEAPPEAQLRARLQTLGDDRPDSSPIDPENPRLLLLATRHREEINGALGLSRADPQRGWSQSDIALLDEITLHLGASISQLSRQEALKKLSNTDPLTGLVNRRGFLAALEIARKRSMDDGKPAALFFVDLDNFKQVNDILGHQAGDELLKGLAAQLRDLVRDRDLVARLGGDEFGLLLQGMSAEKAERRGRDLVAIGEDLRGRLPDPSIELGLSIGITILDPEAPLEIAALLEQADQAMYDAKRQGKGKARLTRAAEAKGAA